MFCVIFSGCGVKSIDVNTATYEELVLAANSGNTEAMLRLGEMYQSESEVERNLQKSYNWYMNASKKKDGLEDTLNALRTEMATVLIRAYKLNNTSGSGTGFFINETQLITCAHVIDEGCYKFTAQLHDGTVYNLNVIKLDEDADLALMEIVQDNEEESFSSQQYLEFSDKLVTNAMPLIVSGYPKAIYQYGAVGYSVTNCQYDSKGTFAFDGQTDSGSSGGPILDDEGKVIGVISAHIRDSEMIKLGIPAKTVQKFLDREIALPDFYDNGDILVEFVRETYRLGYIVGILNISESNVKIQKDKIYEGDYYITTYILPDYDVETESPLDTYQKAYVLFKNYIEQHSEVAYDKVIDDTENKQYILTKRTNNSDCDVVLKVNYGGVTCKNDEGTEYLAMTTEIFIE